MKDETYFMVIGTLSSLGALIVAWGIGVMGSIAILISTLMMINAVYCFTMPMRLRAEAKKKRFEKRVSNNNNVIKFCQNFHRQLEREAEREFWTSNKA